MWRTSAAAAHQSSSAASSSSCSGREHRSSSSAASDKEAKGGEAHERWGSRVEIEQALQDKEGVRVYTAAAAQHLMKRQRGVRRR